MKQGERIRVAPGPLAKDVPVYHASAPRRRIEAGDEVIVTSYHLDLYHQGLLVEFVEPSAAPAAPVAEIPAAPPAAPAPEPAAPAPEEVAPPVSTPEGGNA